MRTGRGIWVLAGIVLAAGALLVAGCGGDEGATGEDEGDTGETAATPAEPEQPAAPTKQEYIAEADTICREAQREQADVVAELNKHLETLRSETAPEAQRTSATAAAEAFDTLARARDDVSRELEALEAPKGGAAKDYLESRKRNTQALRESAKAFRAFASSMTQETADAATAAAERNNSLSAEGEQLAKNYGLEVCGQPIK